MFRFSRFGIVITLAATAGVAGCHRQTGAGPAAANGRGASVGPAVPVVAGKVELRDTPIYLDGIGTAQAFNTVTIHVQVDGILEKVAFKEGQDVKKGDLLASIDARPYEAQLAQARAKKAADQAQLSSAEHTFERNHSLSVKVLSTRTRSTPNRRRSTS